MACRAEITDDVARHFHQVVAAELRPHPVQVWVEFPGMRRRADLTYSSLVINSHFRNHMHPIVTI